MRYLLAIFAFLAGAAVASVIWSALLVRCHIEMAANYINLDDEQAMISEHILTYLGHPDPAAERLVIFSATNHIAGFCHDVDYWNKQYPYMDLARRWASRINGYQMFMKTNDVLNKSHPPTNTAPEPTAP